MFRGADTPPHPASHERVMNRAHDFVDGLGLYTGDQTLSLGPRWRTMPISALW
jgi:hypothetical protein